MGTAESVGSEAGTKNEEVNTNPVTPALALGASVARAMLFARSNLLVMLGIASGKEQERPRNDIYGA